MANVTGPGSKGAAVPPPNASSSSTSITPEQVYNTISAAQKRVDQDAISAQNPGVWTHVKEFFNHSAKDTRLQRIKDDQSYDNIMQQCYAMIASIYQAMVDPTASVPMAAASTAPTQQQQPIA